MASMQVRRAAIKALEDRFGCVTASRLVEESKKPKHPLHKEFLWGADKEAAHQHRLNIARHIISSVRIVMTHSSMRISCVGYLRNVEAAAKGEEGYRATTRIASDRDLARETLQREIQSVQSALERAVEIASFFELQDDLTEALDAVLAGTSRMRKGFALPDAEEDRVGA